MAGSALVTALRVMVYQILTSRQTIDDLMSEAERLAESGGSGTVWLRIDLKDARTAWAQIHSIESSRVAERAPRRRFDISSSVAPE